MANLAQILGGTSESGSYTPQDIARKRALATQLLGNQVSNAGPLGAVANALSGGVAGYNEQTAATMEAEGQNAARERLIAALNDPGGGVAGLAAVASDPFLSNSSAGIASALLGQKIEQQDPMYNLQRQKLEQEIAMMGQPQQTDTMQNLAWRADQAGLVPGTPQYQQFMETGGQASPSTTNIGTIPAGYQVDYDEMGRPVSMSPIPNSPAALAAEQEQLKRDLLGGGKDVVTDTIVSEAQKAREAAKGFAATGVGNFLTGGAGFMPAAQVNQHVESLKAIASSENINAMRQSSPTGGALGNTSDADLRLLQNKAGALNPQSPTFERDLADYERTLLRIVHGPEAGDIIYESTRPEGEAPAGGNSVDDILKGYGL